MIVSHHTFTITFYGNLPLFQAMPSQGKSEGFDSWDWPSNLTEIGLKSSINQLVWPWNLMNGLDNNKVPLLYYIKLCASFQIHWWIQTGVKVRPEMLDSGKNWRFFVPRELEIWWMILKNNRAPLLYYIKLWAAFPSHWHIQTGVTVRKRSIRVKICDFLSWVTLKIDVWPWKTIGHLFYTTSSFVHHFKSISEVKLELQPGNAQVG